MTKERENAATLEEPEAKGISNDPIGGGKDGDRNGFTGAPYDVPGISYEEVTTRAEVLSAGIMPRYVDDRDPDGGPKPF